jgi:prepilin-type N-terminal cleavage/methylation domain-containing protein
MGRRRAFTLIEILIVMAVITILGSLLSGALLASKRHVAQKVTVAQIAALRTAIASYHGDHRRYPRLSPLLGTPDALMADDGPALFAAVMDPRSRHLRGWETKYIGLITDRTRLAAATMGQDGNSGARFLTQAELQELAQDAFLAAHGPLATEPLVFIDVWGNPYHYREWASIANSVKQAIDADPPLRTGIGVVSYLDEVAPLPGPIPDRVRDVSGYTLWSNGPNGINEFGAPRSDDITLLSR